jgi:opacity protein-like surface antigen
MKKFRYFYIFFFFSVILSNVSAQKLTIGVLSGTNFSNLQSENLSGKWKSKTGTINGIFVDYSLNRILSFGTGLDFTSLYYQFLDYSFSYPLLYTASNYTDVRIAPIQNYSQITNLNFYRIPLYFKLSTPTRIKFSLSGGLYYSFLSGSRDLDSYLVSSTQKNDVGYMISSGFSYPVTNDVEIFLQGRYSSGFNEFLTNNKGRNAATELVFGIGYSGFFNHQKLKLPFLPVPDSTDYCLTLKYKAGSSFSWVGADKHQKSYSQSIGYSSGIALNYKMDQYFSLQTELLFEQKGYQLSDSTSSTVRYYVPSTGNNGNDFSTKTTIRNSYLTLPVLLQFSTTGKCSFFVNGGIYISTLTNVESTGTSDQIYRYEGSYSKTTKAVSDNVQGYFTDFDSGWIAGCGLNIPVFKNWKLNIECRYQEGWTNILKFNDNNSPVGLDLSTKSLINKSTSIQLGLEIPIY